jgi:prepilin-type N-terminal cleavage/methylation domain-containing protein/prepilin-type processing-associated H-X9-DG protein
MARRGVTILELLVVVTIIGLLLALILPAVSVSRETARKAECMSHLKQIGVAIAAYESLHGMFPPGGSYGASMHVSLLPFLGQKALYDRYDFIKRDDTSVRTVVVPLYLCPSDPAPNAWMYGGRVDATTSYAGNSGTGVMKYGYNGMFRHISAGGKFERDGPIRAADVFDGLSNTAAVSEILHGDGSNARLRVNWNTPKEFSPEEFNEFAKYCSAIPPIPVDYGWKGVAWARGVPWTMGEIGFTMYNHILQPNEPSCYNQTSVQSAIASAGSAHTAGVNVLFGDGRVNFVANNVDLDVWREFGSRVGSDLEVIR